MNNEVRCKYMTLNNPGLVVVTVVVVGGGGACVCVWGGKKR